MKRRTDEAADDNDGGRMRRRTDEAADDNDGGRMRRRTDEAAGDNDGGRMKRRTFVAGLLSAYPLIRSSAQDSSAGRLRDPDVVQQRSRTVEGDNDLVVQNLEKRLRCTCGCNLDVFTCRTTDFTCTTSPAMHREVLQQMAAGSDSDEVVANFVSRYGEQILMQPPKRGFNWTAYLTPFAALVFGAGIVTLLMRRWMRRRSGEAADNTAADETAPDETTAAPLSAEDRRKLTDALSTFES